MTGAGADEENRGAASGRAKNDSTAAAGDGADTIDVGAAKKEDEKGDEENEEVRRKENGDSEGNTDTVCS